VRALRAAAGERGKRANFKFLTVRSLISAWTGGGYGNAAGAARGHRGEVPNRPIADCRLQIWQRGTIDCGLLHGKAKGWSDRNTLFIDYTEERGLGLEENLRLSSLIPAYSRLFSLIGRKIVAAPPLISDASSRFRSGCGRGRPRSGPRASSPAASPAHRLGSGVVAHESNSCRRGVAAAMLYPFPQPDWPRPGRIAAILAGVTVVTPP